MDFNLDLFNNTDISPFDEDIQEDIVIDKEKDTDIELSENNKQEEIPIDGEEIFSSQEGVDREESQDEEDAVNQDDSNSPNLYTSIAKSLLGDGILSLDENEISKITNADELAAAFKKQAEDLLNETQKRINDALNSDVEVDDIKQYEGVLSFLNDVSEDMIKAENDEGEKLRKNLIYQDYINRGFKQERALKEVEKSFNAGTDIEDAIASLDSNKEYFTQEYNDIIESSKKEKQEKLNQEKQVLEDIKKNMLSNEEPIKGVKLDKKQRDELVKLSTKIIDKDKQNRPLTSLQKYANDNPVDYQYKLNLLYYLTDGFKDLDKLIGKRVTEQTKSKLSDLEKVLKNPRLDSNGSYDFSNSKDKESKLGIVFAKDA